MPKTEVKSINPNRPRPHIVRVALLDGPEAVIGSHGQTMRVLLEHAAPAAEILSIPVFDADLCTSARIVATAIVRAIVENTDLISMSLGLTEDRAILRDACERAIAANIVLVASVPARGQTVFPGNYPGVIRATGDARCAPGEFSHLATRQADFGAAPHAVDLFGPDHPVRGASCSAARVAGHLAALMTAYSISDRDSLIQRLASDCHYRGNEQRRHPE